MPRTHAPCPTARSLTTIRYFPAFLDLAGRRALVLGSGEAASRKAAALARAGADIRHATQFTHDLLTGCALAIGADAPEAELEALSRAAQAAGVPVNVVDRPELCSFISPAVVDRNPLTIAISSGGAAPVLARDVRARIEALLPPGLGRLAALLDELKAELRAAFPGLPQRRAAIDRILAGPAADKALSSDMAAARAEARAVIANPAAAPGMVWLVGAGPGAADLLTLRAHRLLGEADVVVHDRLVSDAVLDLGRRDAERIAVGKQGACHSVKQEAIAALLIDRANAGQRVVRLKGGDPSVFGRLAEEAAALEAARVAYEIVPGVTAALACAAQARVALTGAGGTRCLTMITAHRIDGRLDLDCTALAALGGTLAVYMAGESLATLCSGLREAGLAAATPAVLVEHGGSERQRALHATLASLPQTAIGWPSGGPTLLLLGAARLREPAAIDGEWGAGDGAGGVRA